MARGSGGVFRRILELALDRASAKRLQKDAQQALKEGTDPKAAQKNLAIAGRWMEKLRKTAMRMGVAIAAAFAINLINRFRGEIDNALSIVRRQTGDTGAAFAQLGVDLRETFRTGPEDIEQVAQALSVLRTQTGLIGPPLQRLTRQVLDFARITGEDAAGAAELTGQLLNRLGLEAEHAEGLLDRLTVAGQETGVSISALAQGLLRGSDALGTLGLSINQQIALLAQIEKRGGDLSRTAMALNTALVRFAQEGVTDGAEAFALLMAEIRDAPDDFAATRRASEIFGQRMGATFAADVRQGRLNIEELTDALDNADGALKRTTDESRTLQEQMKQQANDLKGLLMPALQATTNALAGMALWFTKFGTWLAVEWMRTVDFVILRFLQLRRGLLEFEIAIRRFLRMDTTELDRRLRATVIHIEAQVDLINEGADGIRRQADEARDLSDAFRNVRLAAEGAGEAQAKTAEELRKLEQERISLLRSALDLNIATRDEKVEVLARVREINRALKEGNQTLEERIRLTQNLRTLMEGIGLEDIKPVAPQLGALRFDDPLLSGLPFASMMGAPDPERFAELLGELQDQWLRANHHMIVAAQSAAWGIERAFSDAFRAIGQEGVGIGGMMETLFRGFGAAAIGALAELAGSKAAENVARAVESFALASGMAAIGNFAGAAAAKAAGAQHIKAAALWSARAGAASGAASAVGGGFSGSSGQSAGRSADRADPIGPDIIIRIDGVDPKNPRHQQLVGETDRQYRERYGGRIRVEGA